MHEAASLLVSLSDTILSSPAKPVTQQPIAGSTGDVCTTDAVGSADDEVVC